MEHLKIAIGIHPKYTPHQDRYAKLATELAEQHHQNGETETGINVLIKSIEFLKPFSPNHELLMAPYDLLAEFYSLKGDFLNAIDALKFVALKRPDNQLVKERMGQYLASSNQPELAESVFRELLETNPQSAHYVATLGRFLINQNQGWKARELIEEANSQGITSETLRQLRQSLADQQ